MWEITSFRLSLLVMLLWETTSFRLNLLLRKQSPLDWILVWALRQPPLGWLFSMWETTSFRLNPLVMLLWETTSFRLNLLLRKQSPLDWILVWASRQPPLGWLFSLWETTSCRLNLLVVLLWKTASFRLNLLFRKQSPLDWILVWALRQPPLGFLFSMWETTSFRLNLLVMLLRETASFKLNLLLRKQSPLGWILVWASRQPP